MLFAARARARAVRVRAGLLLALGLVLLLAPLPLAFAARSALARHAVQILPLAGLIAFLALFSWRRRQPEEEGAQLLAAHVPRLRSSLLTAVQLQRELESGAPPFSRELALAHIAQATVEAHGLDLARVIPRTAIKRAGLVALTGLAVFALSGALAPRLVFGGIAAAFASHATAGEIAERLQEPITYDIELTYLYPAYTGLPTKTVPGTDGQISAPAGTEVRLRTRADRQVARAYLVVGEQALPLQVSGGRNLSGSLLVQKPGSYHFRFADARGHAIAEGPPIPIAVEADAPPKVTLFTPPPDLEVEPKGQVTLRYEAEDDYGLAEVDLVYRIAGSKSEQQLVLSRDPAHPRRAGADYLWQLVPLGLSPGDRVAYHLEATDTDAVSGPKVGRTREQELRVYSEAEHHRLALARVDRIWEALIGQLGDTLEAPERQRTKDLHAVAGASALDQRALDLATEMRDAAADLLKDRAAPREIPRALSNIASTLRLQTQVLSDARATFARWSRPGAPDAAAARRLGAASDGQVGELEKDTIYLEKLLDHRRIEDLLALSRDLSAKRRDLAELLERYRKAPDEKTKQAIQDQIARLKARIGELLARMAELSRGISDEHLNADALKQMQQSDSMLGTLDKVQDLLNQGKVDEAMKALQRLGDQMDQLAQGLDQAKGGFDGRQDPELARQFQRFNDQLADATRAERDVQKETKALRDASRAQLQKRLEEKGPDFTRRLREKVAQSKQRLQTALDSPGARAIWGDDGQRASEALDELDRALAAKDFDAASEEASVALDQAQQLAGELRQEATRARRFPAFAPGDPGDLDRAAGQADGSLPPILDVKKALDQLFPRSAQSLSPQDRQKLQELAKRQRGLAQQAADLQKQMESIGKKAPIFSPKTRGQMQSAGSQMQQAEGSLGDRDPTGAAAHQGQAADALEQVQKGVQEATKGGGAGGGLLLPAPDGSGEDQGMDEGSGLASSNEKVEIPGADRYQAPEEYRKDIMDAMKQSAPPRYKDQVKKYYEEIVK